MTIDTNNPLSQNREELLKGIRATEKKYYDLFLQVEKDPKKQKKKAMLDALYTCIGLYGDCLERPTKTKPQNVVAVVMELKEDLGKDSLPLLRKLHKDVEDVLRVGKTFEDAMVDFFPNSKEISSALIDL